MARLAINELTTFRWSLEEDLEHYAAAGIGAIGVWRQKLADCGEEMGARLLAESGLAISSLQWAGGFTGSEGPSHGESLADARQALRLAANLHADCLIIHSGARGIHTHNHARRLFRQALDKLLPIAEDWGVTLAVEPMQGDCGSEWTFLNCLDETLELVAGYDSSALKIVLDTYHWASGPALFDRLPRMLPRLALVQLGDARQPPAGEPNRCPLGKGVLPLKQIVSRLIATGYEGHFEVELMGEEIEACDYHELLAESVRTFDDWAAAAAR
ncbi:MAG TPA: sugar phosphate isomerase/epimerase family protein [Pirellulaceae bacterium]|nr:sugar phosphate isomerase/epimerase family protein [Pirellulaceae bacterium]